WGRAVAQGETKRAHLHEGDHRTVVVVPARRAARGDRDLEYGHVGLRATADFDSVRRRTRGQDSASDSRTRRRGHHGDPAHDKKAPAASDNAPTKAASHNLHAL